LKCALCKDKDCYTGKDCTDIKERSIAEYTGDTLRSMEISASIEARHYMKKTRLEELILYARGMDYERLGIAFCIGMGPEVKIINEILSRDFKVFSVCCKVCGIDKSDYDFERLHDDWDHEATCNPVGQATILNEEKTDLNIIIGLCIGHDTIFTRYSDAPVTTFVVKDRVLSHNPLGVIYSNYYLEKMWKIKQ